MKLTDERFWIWEIALTLSLSALPLMLYGDNIGIVTLIIVSYAIAGAIGLMFSSKTRCVLTWFLMFVISVGADLFFADISFCKRIGVYRWWDYHETYKKTEQKAGDGE